MTTPATPTPTPSAGVPKLSVDSNSPVASTVATANSQIDTLNASLQKAGVNVPSIPTTPAVVSSKDSASSFASGSTALTKATTPLPPPPTTTATPATNGKVTDTTSTAVEKAAAAGAGKDNAPVITTGDPVYDSLQAWEKDQQTKLETDSAQQKSQVQNMLTTNLANTNAGYAAQISGIMSSYSALIDTQKSINLQNIGRVKSYGLSSGNAMTTPIEFTYAVSNTEQTALGEIKKLDDQRDSLIAAAQAAEQDADAKLLSASMDSIQKIEDTMRTATQALQTSIDARYATLNKIKDDQQAQLLKTQQTLLAAATTNYGQEYADEKDPTKRDALIKSIVNASGGQLDYGTVYGSLSTNSAALTKAKTDAATSAADLKLKGAQTAEAFANAAKTQATATTQKAFSAIDDRLQPGVIIDGRSDGGTYLDTNGYLTKDGFNTLVQAAHQKGITRTAFLTEYAGHLDPGGLDNYGLTKAEQDKVNDVNKTTPIIIPNLPGS